MSDSDWHVQLLDGQHEVQNFGCGNQQLNRFLKREAQHHSNNGWSKTYVALGSPSPKQVVGYYSICTGSIVRDAMPIEHTPPFPRMPTVHMGKLAVDKNYQGQGLGTFLLLHVLEMTLRHSEAIGISGVDVYAKDEAAKQFYLKNDFVRALDDDDKHLFMHIGTIRQLFPPD